MHERPGAGPRRRQPGDIAHVDVVGADLSHLAPSGLKSSTIGRRCAAIADRHKAAGLEPPTSSEAGRAVMRGIRRTIGTPRDRKTPATADIIERHDDRQARSLPAHPRFRVRAPAVGTLRSAARRLTSHWPMTARPGSSSAPPGKSASISGHSSAVS
jgi:hypothetical protein